MSDPTMEGYIKLYRKILECEVLKDKVFDRTHAWMDLLIMAKYETEDGLERGQCRITYRGLSERWGWSLGMVQRFIGKLVENGMVDTQTDTLSDTRTDTLLTIRKYGLYQGEQYTERYEDRYEERYNGSRKRKEAKEKEHLYPIIKNNKELSAISPEAIFEELWQMYPRKEGKRDAYRHFQAALKDGADPAEIRDGIERYVRKLKAEGTPTRYTMQGSTWFCQRRWTDEFTEEENPTPARSSKNYDTGVVETAFTKDTLTHGHIDYDALFGGNR